MTYDDFQRAMKRISRWQKKFDEGMKRAHKLHRSHNKQLETAAVNLRNAIAERNKAQKVLDAKIAELARSQARTQQRIDDLKKRRGGQPNAPID